MAEQTGISWCHHTFNHIRGCTKVAQECARCYADGLSKRNPSVLGIWGPNGKRVMAAESYWKEPIKWNAAATNGVCPDCAGKKKIKVEQVKFLKGEAKPETTYAPCSTCRSTGKIGPHRRRVFCASMADVFEQWDKDVYDHQEHRLWVDRATGTDFQAESAGWDFKDYRPARFEDVRRRLFSVIDSTPHLDWLLLTKRPENIAKMWPWNRHCSWAGYVGDAFNAGRRSSCAESGNRMARRDNVWLGTSAGTQESADRFVPRLLECRDLAAVLFVSDEPMLDAVRYDKLPTGDGRIVNALTGAWQSNVNGPQAGGGRAGAGPRLDWLIGGCESNGSRVGRLGTFADDSKWRAHLSYLNEECVRAGVAVFNKQIPVDGELLHDVQKFTMDLRRQEFPVPRTACQA